MQVIKNNETIKTIKSQGQGLTRDAFIRELSTAIKSKIGRSKDKVLTNDAINKVLEALNIARKNDTLQLEKEDNTINILMYLYVEYVKALKPQSSISFLCEAIKEATISDGSRHDRSVIDDNLLDDLLNF